MLRALLFATALAASESPLSDRLPADDHPAWVAALPWAREVTLSADPALPIDAPLAAAMAQAAITGGVVRIPAGSWTVADDIRIPSGVILRGVAGDPPATQLAFPRYAFSAEGAGTPISSAFKGIHLADPAAGHDAGVIDLDCQFGHIAFGQAADLGERIAAGSAPRRLLVAGCRLRFAAMPDPAIPMAMRPGDDAPFQHAWQRWTHRHAAAITAWAGSDVLIAGNHLPIDASANATQRGYRLAAACPEGKWTAEAKRLAVLERDIVFDYDNRPGIAVNHVAAGRQLDIWNTALEPRPAATATGIVIAANRIAGTGGGGIRVAGDGARVSGNDIVSPPGIVRPTARGYQLDRFSNNIRAIELRGWRWQVVGNTYAVHSNLAEGGGRYNDGEGIMHEAWENVGVRDSLLRGNRGNAYLCLWRVPIDGLRIEDNTVDRIHVLAETNAKPPVPLVVRGLVISGNRTGHALERGGGITVRGAVGAESRIAGNRHLVPGGGLASAGASVADNAGFAEE